ncbi:MAG: hypothetical protein AAF297_02790 [Planctomycetota bacterium]
MSVVYWTIVVATALGSAVFFRVSYGNASVDVNTEAALRVVAFVLAAMVLYGTFVSRQVGRATRVYFGVLSSLVAMYAAACLYIHPYYLSIDDPYFLLAVGAMIIVGLGVCATAWSFRRLRRE